MHHRATVRGFDLARIEHLVRFAAERYFDMATGRSVVVGKHDNMLVVIPYDADEDTITPVTIHVTTRQQVAMRLKAGRFVNE